MTTIEIHLPEPTYRAARMSTSRRVIEVTADYGEGLSFTGRIAHRGEEYADESACPDCPEWEARVGGDADEYSAFYSDWEEAVAALKEELARRARRRLAVNDKIERVVAAFGGDGE